jgi:sugar phosphate isomerase/epimerase
MEEAMKLCYQVGTPDVRASRGVTAYVGDLESGLRAISSVGYTGVELMVRDPGTIDMDQVAELVSNHGLDVPMICTGEVFGQDGLTFSDPDVRRRSDAIARMRGAIDLAVRFEKKVNLGRLRGEYRLDEDHQITRARILDAIREVTEYAELRDVTIALEPVNSIALNFVNTTEEGLALVAEVGSPHFDLMLDSNHMFIDDPDINAGVRAAAGHIEFVHLADSNRRYPGNCKLDFPSFIASLSDVGYDGYLGVEVFQIPDQDTALRNSYEYLSRLLRAD